MHTAYVIISAVFNFFPQLASWASKMEKLQAWIHTYQPENKMSNIAVTALKILTGQSGRSFMKLGHPMQKSTCS